MARFDLAGSWTLRRLSDGSERPMAVPGDIASALLAAGEIADPYFDRNELGLQWIGREDWLLERDVEVWAEMLDRERILFEIETLDTIAEISVNGERLGPSANMFRRLSLDVKNFLRPGSNRLSVLIRSPEGAAAEIARSLPYPIPYSEFPVHSPHRNLIRKAQCMAGWDWGPCLMTGGIYDGVSLLAIDGARIAYLTTKATRAGEVWRLAVTAWLDNPSARAVELEARVAGAQASRRVELAAGSGAASLELELHGVEAWWPAGYGSQPLYELSVRVSDADEPAALYEARERIGFRELEVVSEPDEAGRSLVFRVNGRDIFCKGANWIPADALPSRWSRERLDDLLSSAVLANMNCLRVWGGGRYESDDFYELCDEKGILVWQDCMFACALYPSSPAFLAEVEAEIRHQVLRLRDHPSLALWCGNNENIGALGWYSESKKDPMRYIVDYDRLNEGTIGRLVRELDPDRTWWPSSPSGGPSDFSDNWHGDGRGDMHFWSVWHEGKSFSEYLSVKPRFCSEFGFQSFPSYRMVGSFAPEGERNVTSPSMEHHQRHRRGNAIIMETMSRYFRMPSGQRETLYLSQVQQAWAIRTAVDYWRSLRPRCMGALYWQLNDVWPVSSWSSLDYDGGWKLLHYEARRFFEPLHLALIGPTADERLDASVRAVAVNDGQSRYAGRLSLRLRLLDGTVALERCAEVVLAPESSTELASLLPSDLPCAPEEIFVEAILELFSEDGVPERRTAVSFLAPPKRCSLPDPRLEAIVVDGNGTGSSPGGSARGSADGEGPELVLRCERPAFYVTPTVDGLGGASGVEYGTGVVEGRFEDSGFHLMPGEERRLRFIPGQRTADRGAAVPGADALAAALRILHLRASYE